MDRDRRLAEMMGICVNWEPDTSLYAYGVCKNCGDRFFNHFADPDFTTPEWRAKLMDWAVEQEWFKEFVYWTQDRVEKIELAAIYVYLWRNLATLIVEYHGEGR